MTVDSEVTWFVQVVEVNTLRAAIRPAKRGRIRSGTMVARNLRSENDDIFSTERLVDKSR
jgi:hypothetical protein